MAAPPNSTPRPYVLAETTWKSVREQRYEIAVLPWGATEAHNLHLPYGTDSLHAQWVAEEGARTAWEKGTKVVVLPAVPFGVNTGQLDIPMTINMNPSTQAAVLGDVLDSLNRHGIRRFVILNAHGGNDFRQMIRELHLRFPRILMCALNWYQIGRWEDYFADAGDHAGEMETSVMLHLAPRLVLPLSEAGSGKAKAARIKALNERWAWTPRQWTRVTDDTGIGDPHQGTREKGERYLQRVVADVGQFLVELGSVDPDALYA